MNPVIFTCCTIPSHLAFVSVVIHWLFTLCLTILSLILMSLVRIDRHQSTPWPPKRFILPCECVSIQEPVASSYSVQQGMHARTLTRRGSSSVQQVGMLHGNTIDPKTMGAKPISNEYAAASASVAGTGPGK